MDNKYDEFEFVDQYLRGGEYVLWKGKPEKGNLFTRGDIIPFILSLLWCAVAVYFFADEITSGDTLDFLFTVPFIGIGFYASVGRFMQLASRRKRTWYVITNKKLIRKIGHHVDMLDGDKLPLYMTLWGTPAPGTIKLEDSCLKLRCVRQAPDDELLPMDLSPKTYDDRFAAFAARRQCALHVKAASKMRFVPKGAERAGMAIVQAMNHQMLIERTIEAQKQVLRLVLVTSDYVGYPFIPGFKSQTHRKTLAQVPFAEEEIVISLELNRQTFILQFLRTLQK